MTVNNNLSCIPFYSTKEEQDFRLWYAYGKKYQHYVPSDTLVPFAFSIPFFGVDTIISEITLYDACTDTIVPWHEDYTISENGLTITHHANKGYSLITYFASDRGDLHLAQGMYYLVLKVGTTTQTKGTYYSDAFCVVPRAELGKNIHIEWYNRENLEFKGGYIPYEAAEFGETFKNQLYLDSTIGMPEYQFTEDGEERNGYFFPIKQISEKVYKFTFVAPEYLCDAMRTIRMADYIKITDSLGREYEVEHFEMNVTWLEQGHYASVECLFQTDTIVKKIGKAYL